VGGVDRAGKGSHRDDLRRFRLFRRFFRWLITRRSQVQILPAQLREKKRDPAVRRIPFCFLWVSFGSARRFARRATRLLHRAPTLPLLRALVRGFEERPSSAVSGRLMSCAGKTGADMPSRHGDGWSARWLDQTGVRRRMTFRFKRQAAVYERKMKGEQEEIRRGLRASPPPPKSIESLFTYWIEQRASQKRSGEHDRSIIRAHLRPAFGKLMLHEIGVAQIDKFIVERSHLDKKTIANHLTLLGAMLKAAQDLSWLVILPRIRKPKVRLNADFGYLRTDEELRRFLVAAHDEDRGAFVLYAAAAYTGMRAGELAGLQWGDVSFEQRLIAVQRSYAGPTKGGDVRYVPILDPLLPVLRAHRLVTSCMTHGAMAFRTPRRPHQALANRVRQRRSRRREKASHPETAESSTEARVVDALGERDFLGLRSNASHPIAGPSPGVRDCGHRDASILCHDVHDRVGKPR
jgi:integrase